MNSHANDALIALAATVAVVHTAVGIDHALPFIVLSRVQGWSLKRTLVITALCGVGHIASAVVIGIVAIGLGLAVEQLGAFESVRGQLGIGVLITFGLGYAAVGAVRLWKKRPHRHAHVHDDGTLHDHDHGHQDEHVHAHADERKKMVTAWTLFVVLVFGPCEALVPLLMAPGVTRDYGLLAGILAVFGTLTIVTMLVLVTIGVLGLRQLKIGPRLGPASDVLAGLAIAATGVVVASLGL